MNTESILDRARAIGLHLEARGANLIVRPAGKVPPDFLPVLREHKVELLRLLARPARWGAVPPDGLPLNPAEPRPTPECRETMIAYLRGQTQDHPGPLCRWLVLRENAYFDRWPTWDCGLYAYAAARDAACWQLGVAADDLMDHIPAP